MSPLLLQTLFLWISLSNCLDPYLSERHYLTQFYKENAGATEWGPTSNWLIAGSDHCSWEGVTCSEDLDRRVTGLRLATKGLEGELSEALSFLTELRDLILPKNQLSGRIPESFSRLRNLVMIDLQENLFTEIPEEVFVNMNSLEELYLGHNNFQILPDGMFSSLSKLRKFDGSFNQLKSLPSSIVFLELLESIEVSGNENLMIEEGVFKLASLRFLGLNLLNLQSLPVHSNWNGSRLQTLSIQGNSFKSFPTEVFNLLSLQILMAGNNEFIKIPSEMNVMKELLVFECENCGLRTFPNLTLPLLQELLIVGNEIEVLNLTGLIKLISLSYSANNVFPSGLASFTQLKELNLQDLEIFPFDLPSNLSYFFSSRCRAQVWPPSYLSTSFPRLFRWEVYQHQTEISFPDFLFFSDENQTRYPYLSFIGLGGPFIGTFPSNFPLPFLSSLVIRNSKVSGTIPSTISSLSRLVTLELTGNPELGGHLSSEILLLPNLNFLRINENNLDPKLDLLLQPLNHLNTLEGGICDLSNQPPFECESHSFNQTICNVQCQGDSLKGTWITESNTCKESLLGAKWNQSLLTIEEGGEFSWVSQDSFACVDSQIGFKVEGKAEMIEIEEDENKVRTYRGKIRFDVSKLWVQVQSSESQMLINRLCAANGESLFPLDVWRDDFTTRRCMNSGSGLTAWFPSIRNCPSYYEIFYFDATKGELRFGEGLMWDPKKCSESSLNITNNDESLLLSKDVMRRNWNCSTEFIESCEPECGDGVILGGETCDLGEGKKGREGSGCWNCQIEEGWTCEYLVDEKGFGKSECELNEGSSTDDGDDDERAFQFEDLELRKILKLGLFLALIMMGLFWYYQRKSQRVLMIKEEELELKELLGEGHSGKVFKGIWRGTTEVAVKVLKDKQLTEKEMETFKKESKVFMKLPPHPNIVQFLGICVSSSMDKDVTTTTTTTKQVVPQSSEVVSAVVVTEFLSEGNLIGFMQRKFQESSEVEVHRKEEKQYGLVLELSTGIAAGMDHLHKNNITHQDLAARNVLVQLLMSSDSSTSEKVHRVVPKLTDFGLSTSNKGGKSQIPIRWSAPEVLRDPKSNEPKSDVWSFGIVLFELSTNCLSVPYEEIRVNSEVQKAVLNGRQVRFPKRVPVNFISLAQTCFALRPSFRPTFSQLIEGLIQESNLLRLTETSLSLENVELKKGGRVFVSETNDGYEWLEVSQM